MNNDAPADWATLRDETADLISSTTVLGVLYAFSIILYYLSTRLFYSQSRDIDGKLSRRTLFTFALASVMIVCATIDIITLSLYTKTFYLDMRTLPIGPDRTLAKKRAFAIGKANIVVTFVETTLSLGVLVSSQLRCFSSSDSCILVMACLDYLEWNSTCHTSGHIFSTALSGCYW